jgi:DNA-directed RNA polymerase subunit RPC12/RpoP
VKELTCERCGREFPSNDTLKVRESVLCKSCAESLFSEENIPANQVRRQVDPTVCIGCGLDNGDADLATLGQLPVCPACEALFKNRPFPGWVKATLVGMVALVVSMLVWNWRFVQAYYEIKCYESAMTAGDFQQGATNFVSASRRIPENPELQAYGAFYEGVLLLRQDKSAEALKLLQSCRGRVAIESDLDDLIVSAQIGVAFDQANYDEFLALALQMDTRHKDVPAYVGQLASAYACKYAETSNEQYKVKSLAALDRAKTLASSKPEYEEYYAEYEPRILHRLYTRQIISRNEFNKRYPNGWTQEDEETP